MEESFVQLRSDRPLLHEEGACLPLRCSIGQCRACEDACPTQALSVSLSGLELSESCISCGRCSAACPMQALQLPTLQSLETGLTHKLQGRVTLECERIPASHRDKDATVVPCLGALTAGHILARHAASSCVEILDRGWCDGCEANARRPAGVHPAQSAVDVAGLWLEALEDSKPGPEITPSLLPSALMLRPRPDAAAEPRIDRRSFFREAIARPAGRGIKGSAQPMGSSGRAAYPADRRHVSAERQRQLHALQTISESLKTALPAEFFPTLHIDGTCCDKRMCVALCPTGALAVEESTDAAELVFNSDACIGCENCVKACPHGSLALEPRSGESGRRVLIRHTRAVCSNCGDAYTPMDHSMDAAVESTGLCLLCSKSRNLISDLGRVMRS